MVRNAENITRFRAQCRGSEHGPVVEIYDLNLPRTRVTDAGLAHGQRLSKLNAPTRPQDLD